MLGTHRLSSRQKLEVALHSQPQCLAAYTDFLLLQLLQLLSQNRAQAH